MIQSLFRVVDSGGLSTRTHKWAPPGADSCDKPKKSTRWKNTLNCISESLRETVKWKAERIVVRKELIGGCRDIAFSSTPDVNEMA